MKGQKLVASTLVFAVRALPLAPYRVYTAQLVPRFFLSAPLVSAKKSGRLEAQDKQQIGYIGSRQARMHLGMHTQTSQIAVAGCARASVFIRLE